jgi:hypothetical protein
LTTKFIHGKKSQWYQEAYREKKRRLLTNLFLNLKDERWPPALTDTLCQTLARGSYMMRNPARRARMHQSASSEYMKYDSSSSPILSTALRFARRQHPEA